MAKAVLIMDMPECCGECCFKDFRASGRLTCICTDKYMELEEDMDKRRPDWCPLRELPEKIPELKSGYENLSTSIRQVGWNACLDEILKEPQNEGGAHGKEQSE
jgi:hypothetical protein